MCLVRHLSRGTGLRLLVLISFVALVTGCPSTPPPVPKKCVGGIIQEDGTCVAKCDPTRCLPGNTCVDNACTLTCTQHDQCEFQVQECRPAKEDETGRDIFTCQDLEVPSTAYGDPCPNGNECGSQCITSGPGDALAYCTTSCTADADCPGGYECGYERDPRPICDTNKGNSNLCGQSTEPCVPRSEITAESGLYEGEFCLMRRTCLKRDVCAPCQSDADCTWSTTETHCVDIGNGDKRCAAPCADTLDCEADKQCAGDHCTPIYGSCTGGGFCTPCRTDVDCGTNEACMDLKGNEKGCLDITYPFTCNTDADCPVSPGGRHGLCLDQRLNVPSTSPLYHRCYLPYDEETSTFSCY